MVYFADQMKYFADQMQENPYGIEIWNGNSRFLNHKNFDFALNLHGKMTKIDISADFPGRFPKKEISRKIST